MERGTGVEPAIRRLKATRLSHLPSLARQKVEGSNPKPLGPHQFSRLVAVHYSGTFYERRVRDSNPRTREGHSG